MGGIEAWLAANQARRDKERQQRVLEKQKAWDQLQAGEATFDEALAE